MKTNIVLDVDTVRRVLERSKPLDTAGYDYGDQKDRETIMHALLRAELDAALYELRMFYNEHEHLRPDGCEVCGGVQ